MKARGILIGVLKLLVTAALLLLIFRSVDISKIRQDLRNFNVLFLAVILAVYWLGQLICSERWRIIAAALNMPGSYWSFVRMYFAGMFFNIGLPSLIGGDLIKAYCLSRKHNRPLQTGLVSVLQDRITGLISLLIYGSLAILAQPLSWKGFPLALAYLICWVALASGVLLVIKSDKIRAKLSASVRWKFTQSLLSILSEFRQTLMNVHPGSGRIRLIFIYSFINSALVLLLFHQVAATMGYPIELISFSALFPLVTLAAMLPITLGGLGVREWVYVEALSLAGIPRDAGLIISLATSALFLLCNLGGVFFLAAIPSELRPWKRIAHEPTGQN
jgi:uncharacterized protein (TIRG00374 family)